MGSIDLKECVNCGAGLLTISDICPQCGWQKNKLDESKDEKEKIIENESPKEEIKTESTKEIKLENKIPRPFGIRLLGIFFYGLWNFFGNFWNNFWFSSHVFGDDKCNIQYRAINCVISKYDY
ncbi:MAG: hypothetical protein HRU07_08385 [Nitrosopumilus sp.]|nr:hypothetical protein [Nitrosopumilus sp.]NRA06152.1 hypothetical protein [Nitrosopumilus sp.]